MPSLSPRLPIRLLLALTVVATLLTLPATVSAQAGEPALEDAADCVGLDADPILAEVREVRDVTCHRLPVPLDHEQPAGEEARLDAFHTIANATDLDLLRRALGEDQLVLYGTSYGTKLVLRAAALFPDSWAALVLDSPRPR